MRSVDGLNRGAYNVVKVASSCEEDVEGLQASKPARAPMLGKRNAHDRPTPCDCADTIRCR